MGYDPLEGDDPRQPSSREPGFVVVAGVREPDPDFVLELTADTLTGSITTDLHVALNQRGTVHFAMYDMPRTGLTATDVRDASLASDASLVTNGSLGISEPSSPILERLLALDSETPYWLYVVGEGETAGLQTDDEVLELSWTTKPRHQVRRTLSSIASETINYYIFYPEAYYREPAAAYPVILFLHGNGDRSTSRTFEEYRTSPFTLVGRTERQEGRLADPDLPFIVISPQCVETIGNCSRWRDEATSVVVDAFEDTDTDSRQTLDRTRVYVTGPSSGGEGTYQFCAQYPDIVAAAVPMMSSGPYTTTPNPCNMSSIAIWAFHSIHDTTGSTLPENDSEMVVYLNDNCGMDTLALYSGGDWMGGGTNHVGAEFIYTDNHTESNAGFTSIYEWFLSHRKP